MNYMKHKTNSRRAGPEPVFRSISVADRIFLSINLKAGILGEKKKEIKFKLLDQNST